MLASGQVQEPLQKSLSSAPHRWLLRSALLGLLLAGLFSGCGGSSEEANKVLDRTFSQPHKYSSGQLDADIQLDGAGLTGKSGQLALTLKGPFSSNGKGNLPSFQMDTGLKLGARKVKLEVTSNGKSMWLGIAGIPYAMPAKVFESFKSAYLGKDMKSSGSLLDRLGFRPADWLKDPEVVGDEMIGGTQTVHVRAGVDGTKLVADLGSLLGAAGGVGAGVVNVPAATAQAQRKLAKAVKTAELNVWSGKEDGALRKLDVTVDVGAVDGQRPTKLRFLVTLTDLNQPQQIQIPKTARQFSELTGLIASVSGAGSGSLGAKPSDPKAKRFESCVAKAPNVKAAKLCDKVLTG